MNRLGEFLPSGASLNTDAFYNDCIWLSYIIHVYVFSS